MNTFAVESREGQALRSKEGAGLRSSPVEEQAALFHGWLIKGSAASGGWDRKNPCLCSFSLEKPAGSYGWALHGDSILTFLVTGSSLCQPAFFFPKPALEHADRNCGSSKIASCQLMISALPICEGALCSPPALSHVPSRELCFPAAGNLLVLPGKKFSPHPLWCLLLELLPVLLGLLKRSVVDSDQ